MIINSQGFSHFTDGKNNQDFGIETNRMLLILDGCSNASYSEVGTRLFAQLFKRREEWDNVEKFEENVKATFDSIIEMMKKYYPNQKEMEDLFIMQNLLFTMIACFQTQKEYIVKLFGDGYIITQNKWGAVSYMKFSYPLPPYFGYKYCENHLFKDYQFKTFTFDKTVFPKVAIATDGITPIFTGKVKGLDSYQEELPNKEQRTCTYSYSASRLNKTANKPDVKQMDKRLMEGNMAYLEMLIKGNKKSFSDDVTLAMFGGEPK